MEFMYLICVQLQWIHGINCIILTNYPQINFIRNKSQISLMRKGGNRRLKELLKVYEINQKEEKGEQLYTSKLLDFYKKILKCEINKEKTPTPPNKDKALDSSVESQESSTRSSENDFEKNKYSSISSDNDNQNEEDQKGFVGHMNNWMNTAFDTTTGFATSVKDKITDTNIGSKIVTVGNNTVGLLKDTGEAVITKSTEVAVSI